MKHKIKALKNKNHDLIHDIYGKALLNYYTNPGKQELLVHSDIAETDHYPISWFFRSSKQFPELENIALDLCKGRILDIGAGTGIHTKELQNRSQDCTAIDISDGAVEIMKNQGIQNVFLQDFFTIENQKYDTLLMLMNGFGVMGKMEFVQRFFDKAKEVLTPNGQILVDSSDLIHLYQEEDGSVLLDLNGPYYGEINYQMEFNGEKGQPFPWLFIDFGSLQYEAEQAGFKAVKIFEEETNHYLAQITRI